MISSYRVRSKAKSNANQSVTKIKFQTRVKTPRIGTNPLVGIADKLAASHPQAHHPVSVPTECARLRLRGHEVVHEQVQVIESLLGVVDHLGRWGDPQYLPKVLLLMQMVYS